MLMLSSEAAEMLPVSSIEEMRETDSIFPRYLQQPPAQQLILSGRAAHGVGRVGRKR